ncbi:arsenate reductase/protein-tyrosine-phosphatase family protein [Glutamicibacter sp. BSL13]
MEQLFFNEVSPHGPFRILTVCTGNVCRSPLAALLLRKELVGLPVELLSAGTHALVHEPMSLQNQWIAIDYGLGDAAEHRARQITKAEIRSSDLILALSRDHRRQIVEMLPRASRYTFTLREFARLGKSVAEEDLRRFAGTSVPERLRNAVEATAQLRGSLPLLDNPADDDVIDPYRRSEDIYCQSAEQLVPAVSTVALFLDRAAGLNPW